MIIALTGSNGFVGKILSEKLGFLGKIIEVCSSDGHSKFRLNYPSNITSINPDFLIHCALSRNTKNSMFDENFLGLKRLLDEAHRNPKMQIIYLSSLSSHSQSTSKYGKSKFYCEEFLNQLPNTHIIRAGLISASPPGGFDKKLNRISNIPLISVSISDIQVYLTPMDQLIEHISDIIKNNLSFNSHSIIVAEAHPVTLTRLLKSKRSKATWLEIEIPLSLILRIVKFADQLKLNFSLFDSISSYSAPLELRKFIWRPKL